MNRHELTDEQWTRVEPLLPPLYSGRPGRTYHDHQRILNGLLWLAKTSVPWRDLPERFGPWQTAANCYSSWRRAGIWQRVLYALHWQADQRGSLDWTVRCIDSTSIRVRQHGAGAQGGKNEAIGGSRSWLTTKLHVRAYRQGRPVVMPLTAGLRHDIMAGRTRPPRWYCQARWARSVTLTPHWIAADKGHTSQQVRRYC
jgi:transposase